MSDIFLSYKKEDKTKAQIIAEALEKEGFSVWWDRVIPIGMAFDDIIEEELNASKCVVVLWSSKSIQSDWVRNEAGEGKDRHILAPILIEDVKPPFAFKRIEAAKLIDWDGSQPDHEFDLLVDSVRRITGLEKEKSVKVEKKVELKQPKKVEKNTIDMKFTLIPAGEFMMGSEEYDNEKPVHKVTINKPFYLGIYPVTQREWNAVMNNNPSYFRPYFKGNNLPVEQVSWNDVQEFIKKLNEKEGADKYRLPSEAEWEYAARAGTTTRYSFGDDESKLGDYAWFYENSDNKTHEVGQKKPNPWNLYDMHGNVWEWVQDRWHGSYDGAPIDGSSWESGDGSSRVVRGGRWRSLAGGCRSAFRRGLDPGNRGGSFGFRLLRIL